MVEFGDLVLPRVCAGCSRPGALLCRACQGPGEPFVVSPAPDLGAGSAARVATVAAAVYDAGLRAAIVAYKERGRRDLAAPLARLLTVAVSASSRMTGTALVLVPVPSSRSATRARGGAHLPGLVRRVSRSTGLPTGPRVLWLRRTVRDSVGLSVAERTANVAGAMAAPSGGWAALIVDDVVTTGATLAESARALQAAGWPVAGAAVIAATALHRATALGSSRSAAESGWLG